MHPILAHLDAIERLPGGGYRLPGVSRAFFAQYLKPYGYSLERISSYLELIAAIRHCNSDEFVRIVAKPAPHARLALLWRRMRRLTAR